MRTGLLADLQERTAGVVDEGLFKHERVIASPQAAHIELVDGTLIPCAFVTDDSGLPGDRDDLEIVKAIIALARSLQIRVVAEGIETTEQLKFLRDRCCDAAQGHLLGLPMQPESFSVQGFHFGAAMAPDGDVSHSVVVGREPTRRLVPARSGEVGRHHHLLL